MAWRGPTTPVTNPAPNKVNDGPNMGNKLASDNRAMDVRRDKDTQKNFSVTLVDVDTAIFTHLNDVIDPQITDNGVLVKVPINYASPERWKAIRQDGYTRDKQGKIQCPTIVYRRTTVQRNDQLITLNRHLTFPVTRAYSNKNQYDRFSLMSRFAPVKETFSVSVPDHIIVTYDFIIWTEKIEQLNGIIEKINWATEDYWGDKRRFKFRTSISDYSFQTEVSSDQDRIVRATFSMMVYTYLLPDTFETHKATMQRALSPRKIVFNIETVTGPDGMARGMTGSNSPEYTQNVVSSEISDVRKYADRTDFKDGQSTTSRIWDTPIAYLTKTGSVVTADDGSGSAVFKLNNTTFNPPMSSSGKHAFLLFVDDKTVNQMAIEQTYVSESNLYIIVNNAYSGISPTTASVVVGYGNIQ